MLGIDSVREALSQMDISVRQASALLYTVQRRTRETTVEVLRSTITDIKDTNRPLHSTRCMYSTYL